MITTDFVVFIIVTLFLLSATIHRIVNKHLLTTLLFSGALVIYVLWYFGYISFVFI